MRTNMAMKDSYVDLYNQGLHCRIYSMWSYLEYVHLFLLSSV